MAEAGEPDRVPIPEMPGGKGHEVVHKGFDLPFRRAVTVRQFCGDLLERYGGSRTITRNVSPTLIQPGSAFRLGSVTGGEQTFGNRMRSAGSPNEDARCSVNQDFCELRRALHPKEPSKLARQGRASKHR